MKMIRNLLLASLVMTPFAAANAADITPDPQVSDSSSAIGAYVRGDFGWSWMKEKGLGTDSTYTFNGGLGYQFTDNIRADITGDWSGNYDFGGGAKASTTALMGNAYYDFANDSMFTPYVGVGAGYGWIDGKGGVKDDSGLVLGAAAGVSVDVTSNLAVDVGYRFQDFNVKGANPYEHQAMVGMRFKF